MKGMKEVYESPVVSILRVRHLSLLNSSSTNDNETGSLYGDGIDFSED